MSRSYAYILGKACAFLTYHLQVSQGELPNVTHATFQITFTNISILMKEKNLILLQEEEDYYYQNNIHNYYM